MAENTLTDTVKRLHDLRAELKAHEEVSARRTAELRSQIVARQTELLQTEAGLDVSKIESARKVIFASGYLRGGKEREKARAEAIEALAVNGGGFLFREYTGTKNYDCWSGQHIRSEYGYGPRHGSVCFRIGLNDDVRKRGTLTPDEIEAAVYYLMYLGSIDAAAEKAAA